VPLVLPGPDNETLATYLLNVAESIHRQLNAGLRGDAVVRLGECATIVARVAQQLRSASRSNSGDHRDEFAALAEAEVAFSEAETQRSGSGLQPPSGLQRRIDRDAIETYLRTHPLGSPQLEVTEARLISGGRCKTTALVVQTGSVHLPSDFILRQDWQGGATDTSVTSEFALLERVSGAGICAPRPLLIEPASTQVGEPFILLERLPGTLNGSLFTPPLSKRLGIQLADQLGRLHALPPEDFRGIVRDGTRSSAQRRRTIDDFRQMQATVGIRSRIVDSAIAWLDVHVEDAGTAQRLTHNDLGFHNFLTEDDKLTAILDWELSELGHPAADLGYVKPFVDLMLPWSEFVARYEDAGGWKVEPYELRFHTMWNAVRLYGLIMQARAALAGGLVSDVEITYACADATMRLLLALGRELQTAPW
jgi:aminoglycoside phosphotransferase (APT) family kinase protein